MERDFTHVQTIFQMLREDNISCSTIETIIDKLPIHQPEKRVMSILNNGEVPEPKSKFTKYFNNGVLRPYESREHRINYN